MFGSGERIYSSTKTPYDERVSDIRRSRGRKGVIGCARSPDSPLSGQSSTYSPTPKKGGRNDKDNHEEEEHYDLESFEMIARLHELKRECKAVTGTNIWQSGKKKKKG